MTQTKKDEEIIEEDEKTPDAPKAPHIPEIAKKVSRFGNQGMSKFGKWASSSNPQLKQRPGRVAARGR